MGKKTSDVINVKGATINLMARKREDYVSLTDMAKHKNSTATGVVISKWLSTQYTLDYIGIWEKVNNEKDFNVTEFDNIRRDAGSQSFVLTTKQLIKRTGAIGIIATPGRYGGTFAHKDIAFEFATWISPEFKFLLVREYQRLKMKEQETLSADWNLQRTLAKINYRIHTDAVREHLIPAEVTKAQARFTYASEADLLNVALFGMTAGQWREQNPDTSKKVNIRDEATLEQLVVLSNMESINALLIEQSLSQGERLVQLNKAAITQMTSLVGNEHIRQIASGSDGRTPPPFNNASKSDFCAPRITLHNTYRSQ